VREARTATHAQPCTHAHTRNHAHTHTHTHTQPFLRSSVEATVKQYKNYLSSKLQVEHSKMVLASEVSPPPPSPPPPPPLFGLQCLLTPTNPLLARFLNTPSLPPPRVQIELLCRGTQTQTQTHTHTHTHTHTDRAAMQGHSFAE
jgi:hypothetical protein